MGEFSAEDLHADTPPDSPEQPQPEPGEEHQNEPQGFAEKHIALGNRIRSGDQAVGLEDFEALGENLPMNAYERITQSVTPEKLSEALSGLSDRERAIIEALHIAQARSTYNDLGSQFGISGSRVEAIERTALRRLKNQLETINIGVK